jgi:hypothetical protein
MALIKIRIPLSPLYRCPICNWTVKDKRVCYKHGVMCKRT